MKIQKAVLGMLFIGGMCFVNDVKADNPVKKEKKTVKEVSSTKNETPMEINSNTPTTTFKLDKKGSVTVGVIKSQSNGGTEPPEAAVINDKNTGLKVTKTFRF